MDFEDVPQANDEAAVEYTQPEPEQQVEPETGFYAETTPDVPTNNYETNNYEANNYEAFPEPDPEPVQNGYSAFPDPEPEDALAVFNRAWNITLDAKRSAEAQHDKEVKAKAAEELALWTQQRKIRLDAKKEKNRSEEQILLETLESEADGGNTWERATKMIDAGAGDSADTGKADVSRMRKLFIQLKGEDKTRAQPVKV